MLGGLIARFLLRFMKVANSRLLKGDMPRKLFEAPSDLPGQRPDSLDKMQSGVIGGRPKAAPPADRGSAYFGGVSAGLSTHFAVAVFKGSIWSQCPHTKRSPPFLSWVVVSSRWQLGHRGFMGETSDLPCNKANPNNVRSYSHCIQMPVLTLSFSFCPMGHLSGIWLMKLDHIKAEIARMRVQIKRQQRDILDLQRAGIGTASAIALLERMHDQVDGKRNRLTGEARVGDQHTYVSGKTIRGVPSSRRM